MTTMLEHYHNSPSGDPPTNEPSPGHGAVAERARALWLDQGCPENCDEAIWLEAEAELLAIQQKRYRHPHLQINPNGIQPERELRHAK